MSIVYHEIEPFGLMLQAGANGYSMFDIAPEEIERLLAENRLLLFRGFKSMTETELIEYSRQFGPLKMWEFGELLNLRVEDAPKNHLFTPGRVELHWDGAYIPEVPKMSVFQCIHSSSDVSGGQTLFLDTVKLLQEAEPVERDCWLAVNINYGTDKVAHFGGQVTVPLVGEHPYTGETNIRYIEAYNEDNADINPIRISVVGMDETDQQVFLHNLNKRLYADEYMYRHEWQTGDFLIFDNHALLHGRAKIRGNLSRHVQRIHVLDRPGAVTAPERRIFQYVAE